MENNENVRNKNNKILFAIIAVLLIAVLSLCGYILLNKNNDNDDDNNKNSNSNSNSNKNENSGITKMNSDECSEAEINSKKCTRYLTVNDKDVEVTLIYAMVEDIEEEEFVKLKINGKDFYHGDYTGLDKIETIEVFNNLLIVKEMSLPTGGVASIYIVDTNANLILNLNEIEFEDMNLFPYLEDSADTYKIVNNKIVVRATRTDYPGGDACAFYYKDYEYIDASTYEKVKNEIYDAQFEIEYSNGNFKTPKMISSKLVKDNKDYQDCNN